MNSEKYYNNTIMTFEVYNKNSIFIYLIRLSEIDKVVCIQLQATRNWVEPSINIPGISGGVTARKRVRGDTNGVSMILSPVMGGPYLVPSHTVSPAMENHWPSI